MNIDLKITSKIHWIHLVLVAATQKIQVTFSSTVLIVSLKDTLLNKITNIDSNILNQAAAAITQTLLFGNSKYSNEVNLQILNAIIDFILIFKRFDEPTSL